MKINRRRLIKALFSALVFLTPVFTIGMKRKPGRRQRFIRPPGALKEDKFKQQCIGCFKCATSCPNDCIEMAGFEWGLENVHTPVILPRSQACTLCMRCTEVCPTGALSLVEAKPEIILEKVKMGTARVDESLCFSFHGRTCGVCYRACPYPGKAMTIGMFEQPTIHENFCVGCGLCEQACIHMPHAVRVIPPEGIS